MPGKDGRSYGTFPNRRKTDGRAGLDGQTDLKKVPRNKMPFWARSVILKRSDWGASLQIGHGKDHREQTEVFVSQKINTFNDTTQMALALLLWGGASSSTLTILQ